jgi:hypothetical protein
MRLTEQILIIILILISPAVLAQEPVTPVDHPPLTEPLTEETIEERLEVIGEDTEEAEIDYTTLIESLSYYQQNPLNLNSADKEDLQRLLILNDMQIAALLDHIHRNGKLLRLEELQTINGFDPGTIRQILPYVRVTEGAERDLAYLRNLFKYGKHQVMIRYQRVLQVQRGFMEPATPTASHYLGSQDKIYTRYRFTFGNRISWGFTGEKDAGEEFFKGSNNVDTWYQPYKGFDFYSAHLFVRNIGIVKAVAIGDYQVEYGQGLIMWSGLAFGKSADVFGIKKSGLGIKPYTSVNENLFMRGGAISLGYDKWKADFFYSNLNVDASITAVDTLDQVQEFSSFQESGFHRTPTEIKNKNRLNRKITGTHVSYKTRKLELGATAMQTTFGADLIRRNALYNYYQFSGKEIINYGIDFSYMHRNYVLFGEAGRSDNGGNAILAGILASIDPRVNVGILYRNYEKNFHALSGNSIAESSNNNEKGTYLAFSTKPARNWTLSAYYDVFSFPWLKYLVDAPSRGFEYLAQVNYRPSRQLEMYFRKKHTHKEVNVTGDPAPIDYLVERDQRNYRFHVTYKVSNSFTLRNRVELSQYRKADEPASEGYMIYLDVTYRGLSSPFTFSIRYLLFDTDDYNSRIYAYENDVLYAYSIPGFFYRGSRFYAVTKYRVMRGIEVWFRYANTFYSNRNTVGSGLDIIQGSNKSEVKAQVRFTF